LFIIQLDFNQGLFQERQKVDFRLRNAAFRAFVWRSNLFCFPQQSFAELIRHQKIPRSDTLITFGQNVMLKIKKYSLGVLIWAEVRPLIKPT
jgi:hypothetical protein